ncbi:MAG: MerR family transcriptional regulator [Polyangiales bacterium]
MHQGQFKIGRLAVLSGFGVQTLRNWERRYGLLLPQRVPSGHRLYTPDDLLLLQRVRTLLDEGRSIGEVVALGRDALLARPLPDPDVLAGLDRERPAEPRTLQDALPYFVLDALPCGVLVTDLRGRTLWVNKSCERICGYPLADLRDRTPGSVLQGPDTNPRTVRQLAEAVARVKPLATLILNYDKNQRAYWADIDIVPLIIGTRAHGFVATVWDATADVTAGARSP